MMTSARDNISTASYILAKELSEELQSKLHQLTVSHQNCERLLRYLTLCQTDHDTVERASQRSPLGANGFPYVAADTEANSKCLSSRVLDPVNTFDSTVVETQTTVGSNSLEDVLCMAREIREKKNGRKYTNQDSSTE